LTADVLKAAEERGISILIMVTDDMNDHPRMHGGGKGRATRAMTPVVSLFFSIA
jgi:hypothetical protein